MKADQAQSFRGRPSILAADGTPLNAEPIKEGVPLQVADIGSDVTACSAKTTYSTLAFRTFMGTRGDWFMPSGGIYRTWMAFAQTPGFESDQLLFDVSFPQTPYRDSPMTHVDFDLASSPAPPR